MKDLHGRCIVTIIIWHYAITASFQSRFDNCRIILNHLTSAFWRIDWYSIATMSISVMNNAENCKTSEIMIFKGKCTSTERFVFDWPNVRNNVENEYKIVFLPERIELQCGQNIIAVTPETHWRPVMAISFWPTIRILFKKYKTITLPLQNQPTSRPVTCRQAHGTPTPGAAHHRCTTNRAHWPHQPNRHTREKPKNQLLVENRRIKWKKKKKKDSSRVGQRSAPAGVELATASDPSPMRPCSFPRAAAAAAATTRFFPSRERGEATRYTCSSLRWIFGFYFGSK